jgi:hypothetical protein
MFTTMPAGLRMNAGVVTPSRGLFLTCRREKYIQYYTIIYNIQYLHVGFLNAKIPYWVGGHQCKA